MNPRAFNRSLATGWLASVCLLAASFSSGGAPTTGKAPNTSLTEPPPDLVTVLRAVGPHPSLGDQARVWDRLVGTWDVQYTDFMKDGRVLHRSGQITFGWVMDGRAIEDVWIVNPSTQGKDREVYADLRYFDPKTGTWRATFIDPQDASVARFIGGAVGDDRIALETQDLLDGNGTRRWSFNDIRPDSFVFRDEDSSDGGINWRLVAEYHMKRRGKGPAP